ncbi:MAG: hypothetical protein HKN43_05665 [Rhodothermales bacterium]|nr:hypothetical protein [Rhodothermales bacterium]
MDDWYKAPDFQNDQLLDELMCEYVDGTMDPSVRSAFDELVNSCPEIARQIQGLTEAQHVLKQTGCSLCAPQQFQSKLRARLNAETGKIDVYGLPPVSTRSSISFSYAVLVLILVTTVVALPTHSIDQMQTPVETAMLATSPASDLSVQMTPAHRPGDLKVGLLVTNADPLHVVNSPRKRYRVPTAEAELTFLGD